MQAPQNFASAHRAQAASASYSNRAVVNDIFQNTGAFLDDFRTEFLANARARHKETESYLKNLRRSVQDMLTDMRQNREDATNGTRELLDGYMEDLREVSRLRQQAAHELAQMRAGDHDALCGNARQQLEELADKPAQDRTVAAQRAMRLHGGSGGPGRANPQAVPAGAGLRGTRAREGKTETRAGEPASSRPGRAAQDEHAAEGHASQGKDQLLRGSKTRFAHEGKAACKSQEDRKSRSGRSLAQAAGPLMAGGGTPPNSVPPFALFEGQGWHGFSHLKCLLLLKASLRNKCVRGRRSFGRLQGAKRGAYPRYVTLFGTP